MAVRNREKGIAAAKKIREEFSHEHPDMQCPTIKVWILDMSSYDSVLAFSKRVKDEAGHVDIAILNAGVQTDKWEVSEHGHEMDVQVDYLSTALLAIQLRKIMHESYVVAVKEGKAPKKQPVLELVGSDATTFAQLPELRVAAEKNLPLLEVLAVGPNQRPELGLKYEAVDRYSDAKLLEHMFFIEFTRRLSAPSSVFPIDPTTVSNNEVITTLVSPGLCRTDLQGKHHGLKSYIFAAFCYINGRAPEAGGRALTHGSTVGREGHANYFSEGRPFCQPDFLEEEKGREASVRLWEEMKREFKKQGVEVESLVG